MPTAPPLALTALIYPAESNPAVYLSRLAEIGGIHGTGYSVDAALADLRRCAAHMLPAYKQVDAAALYAEQQPGATAWPGTFTITHDPEASAAEAARIREALSAPIPAPEKMLPASQVAEVLRGLLKPEESRLVGMTSFELKPTPEVLAANARIHAAASQLGITL